MKQDNPFLLQQQQTKSVIDARKTVAQLEIEKGMNIADLGCGAGYLTFPLAQKTGERGKVYAVDILKSLLGHIDGAKWERVSNIKTEQANLEADADLKIPEHSCQRVILANILTQVENKDQLMKHAKRVCAKDGKIVIIEHYVTSPSATGFTGHWQPEELEEYAKKQGLKLEKSLTFGDTHYGRIYATESENPKTNR